MLKKIRRDFPLIGSKSEDIDQFVEEIRNCLNEEIPEGCAIKVYKYSVSCCAFIPVGISVEIEGHNEQVIRDLDMQVYTRIIEVLERKGAKFQHPENMNIV
ncbi:MAG: hypothetical protein N3F10_04055 [Candidatus Bathyarchaeota archaeon]|nr:hypothetical protein [Candidatus Bathyarchaeota archaeon]